MGATDRTQKFDYAGYFRRVRDLEGLVLSPDEVAWKETYTPPERSVEALLYLGCNVLITGHLAVEVVAVLKHLGVDFEAVGGPQFCCGIVHHTQGDVAPGKRLAAATVQKLESYGAKTLIMWCPSCDLHFDEVVLPTVAPDFAPEITHTTQFLADRVEELPFQYPVDARIAVHTHLGRPAQERDAAACLKLLGAVPGVEIVGTVASERLGYHCPTPATVEARRVFLEERERLLEEARSLGADTVVTMYHSCHREWCEKHTDELGIRNYISLVAESLGCGTEDRYRDLRRATSAPERLSRAEAQWKARDWPGERAAEMLGKYFPAVPEEYRTDNG
ncbi:MAG TPA: heterodisulfide reductase-related iron-sulfur binding cluster [Actinomycetota bacterium]|nr:heterodisulfide reductase-related iron-sulfur binding cluster [Actinomycetota bacterium]